MGAAACSAAGHAQRAGARVGAGLYPVLALLLVGCASRQQIVEDRWELTEAATAPQIGDIVDLGGGDVPTEGELRLGSSDGVAIIGETLWIRGSSFGRQPSVMVGGRPAATLARTHDGGIVVRVPPLTPAGPQPVVVSNELGRGERPLPVRRLAAVLPGEGGQLAWAEIGPDGPIAAGTTAVPGGQLLALSPEGRAAYLTGTDRSVIEVVEIPATGGPRVVYQLDLGKQPVVALAAAARAPVLAVVRAADVVLVDITSPLRPARSTPRAWPKQILDWRIAAADLSPDGKRLALATEDGNRVVLLDVTPPGRATLAAELGVLADVRQSVLVDVAFSPVGDTLWAAAGDTAHSRSAGPQPTQVFAVRLGGDGRGNARLTLARTVQIPASADPLRLATGRALPLASGSAIRLPPERATVFLAARARPAAAGEGTDAAPPPGAAPAVLYRIGAEESAAQAATAPGTIGLPDLTPDGRWLLAAVAGDDGAVRLLSTPADARPGQTRSIELVGRGAIAASGGRRNRPPQLRVQP